MDQFLQTIIFEGLDQSMNMIVHHHVGIRLIPAAVKVPEGRHDHPAFLLVKFFLGRR
jgi:hypothetical protein